MIGDWTFYEELSGWNGVARVYQNIKTKEAVVVSRADTFDRGDETMIFPYHLESGQVIDWGELYAGYGESHEYAMEQWTGSELD